VSYADYAYYTGTYKGGSIASSEFDRLIERAGAYLDRITGGRVPDPTPDSVKMAACAVAETWRINDEGGELVSQTVGPWSRSYATKAKSAERRLYDAAALYLSGTGLLAGWA